MSAWRVTGAWRSTAADPDVPCVDALPFAPLVTLHPHRTVSRPDLLDAYEDARLPLLAVETASWTIENRRLRSRIKRC